MTTVGVLVPMPIEMRQVSRALKLQRGEIAGRRVGTGRIGGIDVVATLTGIGVEPAEIATVWMADQVRPDLIVVVGVAGSLGPTLAIGEVFVPTRVFEHETGEVVVPESLAGRESRGTLVTTASLLGWEALSQYVESGALAVDMEASAVGRVCRDRDIKWSVIRGISDVVSDGIVDIDVGRLARDDGSADVKAALALMARRPSLIPKLMKVGRDAQRAAAAAARGLSAAIAAMDEAAR